MCVLAAAGGIVGFTRCTNTRVRRACGAGRRAASSSSSSPSPPILILVNGTKSPTASQWNVAPLGTVQPFVGAVKTGGVFIWACWSDGIPCQSAASAVSCQRLNKQQLICISLVPPLLHALLEELDFFIPPQHISELLICFMLSWIQVHSGTRLFFSTRRITLVAREEWLMDMCFHSFQVWSAWLKRHDLDPWWAYGLKTLSDCLAIFPTLIESLMWTRRILIKTRGYRRLRRTI